MLSVKLCLIQGMSTEASHNLLRKRHKFGGSQLPWGLCYGWTVKCSSRFFHSIAVLLWSVECFLLGVCCLRTGLKGHNQPVSFPDLPGCEKAIPFRCLSLPATQFSHHAFPYVTDFYPLKIHIYSLKLLVRYLVIVTELTAYICIVSPAGRDMKNVYTPSYTNTSLQL